MGERIDLAQGRCLRPRPRQIDHTAGCVHVFHAGVNDFLRLVDRGQPVQPRVGHVHHSSMRLGLARHQSRAVRARQDAKQRRLADLSQTHNADAKHG